MSLTRDTVRGSAWIMATSIGARVVGVVGTLVLTRFLDPSAYGEVQAAVVVVTTGSQLSTLGLGQYLIANPKEGPEAAFHATTFHLVLGALTLAIVGLLRVPLGHLVGAPGMTAFLPGLLLSVFMDRIGFMPERMLVRDMKFRTLGMARTASEIVYSGLSIALAAAGWGGQAIVFGNIGRSLVRMVLMASAAGLSSWLTPCRITWEKTRQIFAFGLPLSVGASAGFAARRWDNLVISALFGPSVLGAYNLAYNLADIPAVQVGEQMTDVLLPSFARLDPGRRVAALVRTIGLISLLMTPLAVGLGTISETLVRALFDGRWVGVAPMLTLLAVLSATRPLGGIVWSYLQARNQPRLVMMLEGMKLALLLGVMLTLGRFGPLWACTAVGVAFLAHTLASMLVVDREEHLPIRQILTLIARPVLACVPMVLAVLGVRAGMHRIGLNNAQLGVVVECVVGALAYVPSALLCTPKVSRDFLELLRDTMGRRRAPKVAEA